MRDPRFYVSAGLMIVGVAALTVGADVASSPRTAVTLAVGGSGLVLAVMLSYELQPHDPGEVDERFAEIRYRACSTGFWTLFFGVMATNRALGVADVTTPVLEPLTWLGVLGIVVFFGSYSYFSRVI